MKKIYLPILALAALASCQNEDVAKSGEESSKLTGESTYAVFNIKLATAETRATTEATKGDENAVNKENDIKNAGIFVFKYESETGGISEVSKMVEGAPTADGTGFDVPSTPVMITSGKKHVIVVTNMTDAVKNDLNAKFGVATNANGYADFYAYAKELTGTENPLGTFMTVGENTPTITMSGEADPTLLAGVSETEAKLAANQNHISIYVDRSLAKLDVTMPNFGQNQNVSVKNKDGQEAVVGNVANMTYEVRNLKTQEYIMKHKKGTDFVVTPASDQLGESYWKTKGNTDKYFFPILDLNQPRAISQKLLTKATDATDATYRTFVSYMTENTNEVARIGNSTYAALKAFYKPADGYYVNGYTITGGVVTLQKEAGTVGAGQFSLFNYDYNLAFKSGTEAEATNINYFKTIAAKHISTIEASLKDIDPAKIKFIKGGLLTTAGGDVEDINGYDATKSIYDAANIQKIVAHLNAKANANPTLYVFVGKTTNTEGKLQQYQISAVYMWNPSLTQNGFKYNDGVNFGTLTAGLYNTTADGLQCFYRVNIFDEGVGTTHQMRYSVVRNQSYHMNITKINKIGYPTEIDITINPEEPLNNNTFIQAHILINKWVKKNMNTEIGM